MTVGSPLDLSVVIPVSNEAGNIGPLAAEIEIALKGQNLRYEVFWIDDASSDGTWDEIAQASVARPHFHAVHNERRLGKSLSWQRGFDLSQGEWIATMDGDLQNNPKDLLGLLKVAREQNADFISGSRINRINQPLHKRVSSRIANAILSLWAGVKLRDLGCGLKLFRRESMSQVRLVNGMHRFLSILASIQGLKVVETPVEERARSYGHSHYSWTRGFSVLWMMLYLGRTPRIQKRILTTLGSVALVAAGVFLRFRELGKDSFWMDEVTTLHFAHLKLF